MDRLAAPAQPFSYRTVLGIRGFRRFFVSRAVSMVGDAVVPTALTLSLTERSSGAGWLGALLAAALLPKVIFLTFGGVAADRSPKLPLMAVSSVVCGVAQLATALILVMDGGLWWAFACQVFYGISVALGHPATFGYLPHCVGPEHLGTANALLAAWTGAASLLGPAVTAVFAALGSPSLALAFDGALLPPRCPAFDGAAARWSRRACLKWLRGAPRGVVGTAPTSLAAAHHRRQQSDPAAGHRTLHGPGARTGAGLFAERLGSADADLRCG